MDDVLSQLRALTDKISAVEKQKSYAEQRQRDHLMMLAKTSQLLDASFDYRQTIANVAEMTVPLFAHWACVDLVSNGEVSRVAVAHPDPDMKQLFLEMGDRFPANVNAPRGLWNVINTGESDLFSEVTDEMIRSASTGPEHYELLRRFNFQSILLMPLHSRENKVIGVLTLILANSDKRYDDLDRQVGERIAERCGLAIEHARIYEQLRILSSRNLHLKDSERFRHILRSVVETLDDAKGMIQLSADRIEAVEEQIEEQYDA